MASQRLAVVGVLAVLFLAGCTDDPAHPADGTTPAALPAEFDETTGGLEGVVITQDFLPIPGAGIQIRALDISAVADASGAFSISHLLPGKHLLSAGKAGYLSKSLEVSITEGQVEQVEFQLFVNASDARPKFKDMQLKSGTFGCGASARDPLGFGGSTNACSLINIADEFGGTNTTGYNQAALYFTLDRYRVEYWDGAVLELQWTSTQSLGKGLRMTWDVSGCEISGEAVVADVSGTSPLRIEFNRSVLRSLLKLTDTECEELPDTMVPKECNEEACKLTLRVWPAAETAGSGSPADAGVTTFQPFESALTAFYNQTVPKDFSALK